MSITSCLRRFLKGCGGTHRVSFEAKCLLAKLQIVRSNPDHSGYIFMGCLVSYLNGTCSKLGVTESFHHLKEACSKITLAGLRELFVGLVHTLHSCCAKNADRGRVALFRVSSLVVCVFGTLKQILAALICLPPLSA